MAPHLRYRCEQGGAPSYCTEWSNRLGLCVLERDFDLPAESALIDEPFGELKTNHDILHP